MADAEDLKSSGDFSSCGFDSHPGHQFSLLHSSICAICLYDLLFRSSFGFPLLAPSFVPTGDCDAANTRLMASACGWISVCGQDGGVESTHADLPPSHGRKLGCCLDKQALALTMLTANLLAEDRPPSSCRPAEFKGRASEMVGLYGLHGNISAENVEGIVQFRPITLPLRPLLSVKLDWQRNCSFIVGENQLTLDDAKAATARGAFRLTKGLDLWALDLGRQ
jgi:hypothetical protein